MRTNDEYIFLTVWGKKTTTHTCLFDDFALSLLLTPCHPMPPINPPGYASYLSESQSQTRTPSPNLPPPTTPPSFLRLRLLPSSSFFINPPPPLNPFFFFLSFFFFFPFIINSTHPPVIQMVFRDRTSAVPAPAPAPASEDGPQQQRRVVNFRADAPVVVSSTAFFVFGGGG